MSKNIKEPLSVFYLLKDCIELPISKIHYNTKQVTLQEKENVYNTVSFSAVIFSYSDMTNEEIIRFQQRIYNIWTKT